MRILVSASDKAGLLPFCARLVELGNELISTGGSAEFLRRGGLPVTDVAAVTGFPEILDGRVKTLHPMVFGGILANLDDADHQRQLDAHGIGAIGMVIVNFYPFHLQVDENTPEQVAVELIDIGGPSLVRAAAKNYKHVVVLVDPSDYSLVLSRLESGGIPMEVRRSLAGKAFALTSEYDGLIAGFMAAGTSERRFPERLSLLADKTGDLRYGENPHQAAARYHVRRGSGFSAMRQLSGKPLSYNNLLDLYSAGELVAAFSRPTVAFVKHGNPCGVASSDSLDEAYRLARLADPESAYGAVVAANRRIDEAMTERINKTRFIECLLAPEIPGRSFELLTRKDSRRFLELDMEVWRNSAGRNRWRMLDDIILCQQHDEMEDEANWRVVTERVPDELELKSMRFAWKVCRFVKSNAIVIATGERTAGIGAGQMSRVGAVKIAVEGAGTLCRCAVMASDAFFPFRDGPDHAIRAGVTAIIQPGGSLRDMDTVAACNENGVAMVITGARHFKHE
ncbi:bifunctional phosphoribosylaminoimidazolecarboxamide formyltransferase/IMP cyclohydrolase [bacterium]|nr:bifunctional phosphoribosylaminoimidazolecarboxamide formyltransferase/IMP cyclohydrolase [candidate division CSSED10-310 bacterium]